MKKFITIFLVIVLNFGALRAQNPEWIVFPFDSIGIPIGEVSSIAIDSSDNVWFNSSQYYFSGSGIIKFDGSNFTIFDTTNSDLQNNHVSTLCVDKENNLWAGHAYVNPMDYDDQEFGISQFKNDKWIKINNKQNKWTNDLISDIDIDPFGNIWFAGGFSLLKFDGDSWSAWNCDINPDFYYWRFPAFLTAGIKDEVWLGTESYDEMPSTDYRGLFIFRADTFQYFPIINQNIPWNISDIITDSDNNIWLCSGKYSKEGLWFIQDTIFSNFNSRNSDMPYDSIGKIVIDKYNNKWIGTKKGLLKWDSTTWKYWSTKNSNIPFDNIYSLAIDRKENIWIGGFNCLAVFREGGVILKTEDDLKSHSIHSSSSPNPFDETTNIRYYINKPNNVKINIYNAYGQEISTLIDSYHSTGDYNIKFNASGLANGIYFYKIISGQISESGKIVYLR